MTDYANRNSDLIDQLIGKAGYESPISKVRTSTHVSADTNNVRNSLAAKYNLKDMSAPLESTTAIAKLLAGTSSSQNNGITTAISTYIPTSQQPTATPSSYTYTTTLPPQIGYNSNLDNFNSNNNNNNNYNGIVDKQSGGYSKALGLDQIENNKISNQNGYTSSLGGLDYKFDGKVNPSTQNQYDYKVNSFTNNSFNQNAITKADNQRSNIPDYKSTLTGLNTYQTYLPTSSGVVINNSSAIRRSVESSPRRIDEYFPITDSKQLIKDQTMTRGSAIVNKVDTFNTKNNDIYGSLSVNNQFRYGGSISGATSIRDTQIMTAIQPSITGNIRESVSLPPTYNNQQISFFASSSPKASEQKLIDQQRMQSVLSKFASYQPTPLGVRSSGLRNSTSTSNLYRNQPTEPVEETIKRANNAIKNSLIHSSSQKNFGVENNLGVGKSDIYTSSTAKYEPIIVNSKSIGTYSQPALTSTYNYPTTSYNTVSYTSPISNYTQPVDTYNIQTYPTTADAILDKYDKYTYPVTTTTTTTDKYNNYQTTSTIAKAIEVDVFSTDWQSIISRGERDGTEFSDSEFLPSPATIGGKYQEIVQWLRPREIFNTGYEVFVKGIDPTTLIGGDLGDAYFQGSISALAERDFSILKLFQTKSVNKAGCYVLNICWKGVWTQVILDDRFPTKSTNADRQICFTRSSSNELWAILLEKAWAKLHGSYAKIDGGLIREVLHDFTGAPCRTFFIQGEGSISRMQLWERIQHAEDKDLVVLASCMDDLLETEQEQIVDLYGITNMHPYTLLGTIELRYNNQDYKFIKLRNPNCKQEWQHGSEDKYFNQLPQDVVSKLNYGGRCTREGFFLMEFEHFYKFFTDMQICYQLQGFQYTGEKLCTMRGQKNYYKVEVNQAGFYFFQVSQQSIRTERISEQIITPERDYYSQVYLCLAPENNPTQPIIQVTGNQRDLSSNKYIDNPVFIPQGQYCAFVEVDWKNFKSSSGNCGFGAYGSNFLEIRASNNTQCSEFANHVDRLLLDNSSWEQV